MNKISNATFSNNTLILDEKLNIIEGKKVKIVIFDETEKKKSNFFEFIKNNQFTSKVSFKFDSDEINER
jgi:predicted DNA-binding antitoxin AbrB/MazE fold protein